MLERIYARKTLLLSLVLLLVANKLNADVIKDGRICSYDKSICIDAVIKVDDGSGLVTLNGRVLKTTRPGYLKIKLLGFEKNKVVREAYLQGRLEGKYSERVNLKNSASHSSDAKWKVKFVDYLRLD